MSQDTKPLRADAQRNRARVLDAAETVLARDGLSASMRAIAAEAGVGLGTIYRHFPTQEALYQAIIVDRLQRVVAEADALATADDPGAALFGFLTRVVEVSAKKKTLANALAGTEHQKVLAAVQRDVHHAIDRLVTRARASGAIRTDLRTSELLALLSAACLASEQHQWDHALRTRVLRIMFDGLRATE